MSHETIVESDETPSSKGVTSALTKKILLAVATCHGYRHRANVQRETWVKDVGAGADVRFFLGEPHQGSQLEDEIWLGCPDGYADRKEKVIAIIRWAVEGGYDYLWKLDDDVYLRPERLLTLDAGDYCGATVGENTAISGAIYGLSLASMKKLLCANAGEKPDYEDLWVGRRLAEAKVTPTEMGGPDKVNGRFRMTESKRYRALVPQDPPLPTNDVIASWEHPPERMVEIHQRFHS